MKPCARFLGVAPGLALLVACAARPPSPAPIVSLASQSCTLEPDLVRSTVLLFDAKKEKPVEQSIDASAPCFEPQPGMRSLYHVFILPESDPADPYIVSIASSPFGAGVFAPNLVLLGSDGKPKRAIGRDQFMFRGGDLSVIFRSHPDERYLVVGSDPEAVGKSFEHLNESVVTSVMSTGYSTFAMHTGTDQTSSLVYAHNGKITVTLSALPDRK